MLIFCSHLLFSFWQDDDWSNILVVEITNIYRERWTIGKLYNTSNNKSVEYQKIKSHWNAIIYLNVIDYSNYFLLDHFKNVRQM